MNRKKTPDNVTDISVKAALRVQEEIGESQRRHPAFGGGAFVQLKIEMGSEEAEATILPFSRTEEL